MAQRHRRRGVSGRGGDPPARLRPHPRRAAAAPVQPAEAGALAVAAPARSRPPRAGGARVDRGGDLLVHLGGSRRAVRRRAGAPAAGQPDQRRSRRHASVAAAEPDPRGAAQRRPRPARRGAVRGRPTVCGRPAGRAGDRRRGGPRRPQRAPPLGGGGALRRCVRRQGRRARGAGSGGNPDRGTHRRGGGAGLVSPWALGCAETRTGAGARPLRRDPSARSEAARRVRADRRLRGVRRCGAAEGRGGRRPAAPGAVDSAAGGARLRLRRRRRRSRRSCWCGRPAPPTER